MALMPVLASCSLITDPFATNESSGDPFPVTVSLSSGAITAAANEPGGVSRVALIDILSPLSILDIGPNARTRSQPRAFYLVGAAASGAREVARALLRGQVLEAHPCPDPTCEVGDEGTETSFGIVLGADLFAGDALRLDLSKNLLSIYPDIAGSNSQRTALCEAVLPEPFRGGGTLVVGGTELPYVGRRVAISACASFQPRAPGDETPSPGIEQGTDLLLLASSAFSPTLLSESAYERYRVVRRAQTGQSEPELSALQPGSVTVPSGRIDGRKTTLPNLTLLGQTTDRGACADVHWHRGFLANDCQPDGTRICTATRCGAPAQVELVDSAILEDDSIDVLVVSDTSPLLVGLRTELHPDTPEVDGIIGTQLLRRMQVDLDYPNNRVLLRCVAGKKCVDGMNCVDVKNCIAYPELPNLDAATCQRALGCAPAP